MSRRFWACGPVLVAMGALGQPAYAQEPGAPAPPAAGPPALASGATSSESLGASVLSAPAPAEPGTETAPPNDDGADSSGVEPPVARPPWSGKEAIWGGAGLIILGGLAAIAVSPPLCTSSAFGGSAGQASSATCFEAMLGAGGGGAALGVILLVVGERQRSTYKDWLRSHPMFGALAVAPSPRGTLVGWRIRF